MLKELIAKLEAAQKNLIELLGKAKAETDQAKTKEFKSAADVQRQQIVDLKADIEEAKTQAETQRIIDEGKKALETDTAGKNLNPANQPGNLDPEIPDAEKKDREHKDIFLKFVSQKNISDREHDLLIPRDSRFEKAADGAIMLPRSMAKAIGMAIGSKESKTMLYSDTTGGVTDSGVGDIMPDPLLGQLIARPAAMPLLSELVTRVPAAAGRATYPTADHAKGAFYGVAFTWKDDDGVDKTETEPGFGTWNVATKELSGWTQLSIATLRRAVINLEAFLTQLFQNAARHEISRAILMGTGANGQPTGILAAANTDLVEVNRAVANQVSYTDLVNLRYGIYMTERAGARYILHDNVEKHLLGQLDGMDRPLLTQDLLGNGRLVGQPYYSTLINPDLGTKGDIAWGNPANYGLGIEADMAIAMSEHAEFKKGLVVFRLIMMAGGKPFRGDAFAALDVPA